MKEGLSVSTPYKELFEHSKKIKLLESVTYLLEWDQETYMPEGAAAARAAQIELVTSLAHQERTSKEYRNKLGKLVDLDSGQVIGEHNPALKQWYRDYKIAISLPNEFVKAFAKLSSESMIAWQEARSKNTFNTFAPYLTKMIEMSQQKADYLGYDNHPYDALLDLYEPEMSCKQIDPLFKTLGEQIKSLLNTIVAKQAPNTSFLHGKFSHEKQMEFGKLILDKMGFDFNCGRLDLSAHPFSMAMHPTDSRVTTRMHTSSVFDCISAVLHEGGHSLYEMGLLAEHFGSPIGEPISLGIHESQSRFWETRIGQSQAFWQYFLPPLKKLFPDKLKNITLSQFYHAINHVHPSFIRVESDEVTYSLHVILRYELEKQMISGKLKSHEIPEAWREMMETLLGVTPSSDKDGCLQDIHWSMGGIGYFPTYALGNLYAAQFFDAFAQKYPDWQKRVSEGELLFIKNWLNQEIHQHGRTYSAEQLVKKVSGQALSTKSYLNYLNQKYGELYKISI